MNVKYLLAVISVLFLITCFRAEADSFKVKAHDKFGIEREYFTGYVLNPEMRKRAQYRDFTKRLGATAFDPIPKELIYKDNVQRIFRQQCGDCWAQGASTTMETMVSLRDKASIFLSRQQVIDCSGQGSCGGGDISLSDFVKPKGAAYESDYPYQGHDGRCKSVPLHQSAESMFMVKPLTWSTLQRALMETGPLEVCGASSALGNGGWVSRNPGGGTDHCYSLVGWYDGATHGKPAGSYGIIANSWGTNWGDAGFGYYLMAKDGDHLDGNVITEAGGIVYKPACEPQPKADAGPDQSILIEGSR